MGYGRNVSADSHNDRVGTHGIGGLSIRISDAPDDPAWDDFLEQVPIGHYAQTSCWGRARASIGWQPIRVVISEDGQVVAGAQMVTRPVPVGGNIGFVCQGPVIREDRTDLTKLVYDELLAMGATRGVQYLVIQPPLSCDWMCVELAGLGFRRGAFDIDYTATVRIDLHPDIDDLIAQTRRGTRNYLRATHKHVVTVRRGSEVDLPAFNRLKEAHADRLGYPRRDEGYYAELWRALAQRGHVQLFLVEYEGEPIAADLLIPFGDTCYGLDRPWSGEHSDLRPNEALEWEVIKWAKSEGYHFVDFGGIERSTAAAMLANEERPPKLTGAESFKLAFGGEIMFPPEACDFVYNPALRFAYRCIPNRVMRSEWMGRVLGKFRETGS